MRLKPPVPPPSEPLNDRPTLEPSETDFLISIALVGGHQLTGRMPKADFEKLVHRMDTTEKRPMRCTLFVEDMVTTFANSSPEYCYIPRRIVLAVAHIAYFMYRPLNPQSHRSE